MVIEQNEVHLIFQAELRGKMSTLEIDLTNLKNKRIMIEKMTFVLFKKVVLYQIPSHLIGRQLPCIGKIM